MSNKQKEIKQLSKYTMKGLHDQSMDLAKVAKQKGDWVLSESHYQRAEYFLHAMSKAEDSVPAGHTVAATTCSLNRASNSVKRVIKDFDLKRTFRKEPSDTQEKPAQEGKILPFRGHFLRRNRRNTQD